MLLAAPAARAFDFRVAAPSGQNIYYSIIAGTNTVKVVSPAPDWESYTTPAGLLELPATVEHDGTTYTVKAIDAEAFSFCSNMTGIVIPEGVTSIGRMAFVFCSSLDSIVLPSTLTVIGTEAFNSTAFQNNNSHWSDGQLRIGDYLIKVRSSLTGSVMLPDGIRGVANMAFYHCQNIEKVTLPPTLSFIGEQAFNDCTGLDTIVSLAIVPPALGLDVFIDLTGLTAIVPCHTASAYQTAGWTGISLVEDCNTEGIDEVEASPLSVATVNGGIMLHNSTDEQVTVCDLTGRLIAQLRHGFVALPSTGIYMVSLPGTKALKVLFLK